MAKATSRYANRAVKLMGEMIRAKRIEKLITAEDLAKRAGVSRSLIHRVERGDLGVAVGTIFELATILGIPLFNSDKYELNATLEQVRDRLTLLPKYAHSPASEVIDDF